MNWYYVDAGQQAGPVDDAQLQELVRSGKIQPETLVWHEGMTSWSPYRQATPGAAAGPEGGVPPVAEGATAGTASGVVCTECGRTFPPSEVIRYGDRNVCASCKPVFFQRLREGASATPGPAGAATPTDVLARDYDVDIGASLSRGWEVFKTNTGIMIGATVLVYLALIAVNMVPYLSIVLALILNGPLMGGLWLFYVKKNRNEEATIGDAFGGFSPRFWQLVLTQLIPGLIAGALFGLLAAIMVPAFMLGARQSGGGTPSAALLIPVGIVAFVAILVVTYMNVCWIFALPLAADKGFRFWPALELSRRVVNKHWWMTFLLLMVSGVLAMVGLLACGVGLLVSGPVAFAMLAAHYEKLFGDLAQQS
jgi:hypothetical protein